MKDTPDAKYNIVAIKDQTHADVIELNAAKEQLVGLTKEELEKYANDPFWVKLRWTLFVLFWVLWFGAIATVVTRVVLTRGCTKT